MTASAAGVPDFLVSTTAANLWSDAAPASTRPARSLISNAAQRPSASCTMASTSSPLLSAVVETPDRRAAARRPSGRARRATRTTGRAGSGRSAAVEDWRPWPRQQARDRRSASGGGAPPRSSKDFDGAVHPRRARQSRIGGHQRATERFGKHHVARVIGGDVVSERPRASKQWRRCVDDEG